MTHETQEEKGGANESELTLPPQVSSIQPPIPTHAAANDESKMEKERDLKKKDELGAISKNSAPSLSVASAFGAMNRSNEQSLPVHTQLGERTTTKGAESLMLQQQQQNASAQEQERAATQMRAHFDNQLKLLNKEREERERQHQEQMEEMRTQMKRQQEKEEQLASKLEEQHRMLLERDQNSYLTRTKLPQNPSTAVPLKPTVYEQLDETTNSVEDLSSDAVFGASATLWRNERVTQGKPSAREEELRAQEAARQQEMQDLENKRRARKEEAALREQQQRQQEEAARTKREQDNFADVIAEGFGRMFQRMNLGNLPANPPMGQASGSGNGKFPKEHDPMTLKEADPIKWKAFRNNFEEAVKFNKWDDETAKGKLRLKVQEEAAETVAAIKFTDGCTLKVALDAYEKIFVHPAGQDLAEAEFQQAKQEAKETILTWANRVRRLFARAYPDEDLETSKVLRDRFSLGLASRRICQSLRDSPGFREYSFEDTLNRARTLIANAVQCNAHYAATQRKTGMASINAIDIDGHELSESDLAAMNHKKNAGKDGGPKDAYQKGQCFSCGKFGHVLVDCTHFKTNLARYNAAVKKMGGNQGGANQQNKNANRGRGGGNRGNRGGFNKSRGSYKGNSGGYSKGVHALQEEEETNDGSYPDEDESEPSGNE